MKPPLLFLGFMLVCVSVKTQVVKRSKDSLDLTFKGTKINPYSEEFDSTGKWVLTGYVDAYVSIS